MGFNYKAMPTNNTDFNYHTKAVELVYPITWGPYHATSCHWLLLVLGEDTHTQIQTQTHTYMHTHTHT